MQLTNVLCKKVKSKHVLVVLESIVTRHKVCVKRERIADKLEQLRWDPYVRTEVVYKEVKKLKVNAAKSPSQHQHGNLTGSRRVVNDNVVTLYNATQMWNTIYLGGVQALRDVQKTPESDDSFQTCCEKLGVTVESMNQQVAIMQDCVNKFTSLSKLDTTSGFPVFISWSHQAFGNDNLFQC
ncbi:hypothetical protein Fcan01_19511 [Folsomia candida]|uniref:Large ribosomal subunit protein bL33m n=1 Tax=Folsomia candida TaxID=158441 RepID=A0A226DL03_FOLCA|nr:hypothetical protein Fcan01_19511 [Folsomia candida]